MEKVKDPYDDTICGKCRDALRKTSRGGIKFWMCTSFGRSCEKCYTECSKYPQLKSGTGG